MHYIWVNDDISLTWILRPFGDDLPRLYIISNSSNKQLWTLCQLQMHMFESSALGMAPCNSRPCNSRVQDSNPPTLPKIHHNKLCEPSNGVRFLKSTKCSMDELWSVENVGESMSLCVFYFFFVRRVPINLLLCPSPFFSALKHRCTRGVPPTMNSGEGSARILRSRLNKGFNYYQEKCGFN